MGTEDLAWKNFLEHDEIVICVVFPKKNWSAARKIPEV